MDGQAAAAADPHRPGRRILVGPIDAQIETSRTLVLDDDCHARGFFEASWPTTWTWAGQKTSNCCSAAAPERAGPPIHPRAAGSKQRSTDTATWSPLNVFYKNSRCKQYLNCDTRSHAVSGCADWRFGSMPKT